MTKRFKIAVVLGMALVLSAAALTEAASVRYSLRTRLSGYNEVPSVSTTAHGRFQADVTANGKIKYRLRYSDLEGAIQQAHIHFGQVGVNGGITVFLCTNLGNGPEGTQTCPDAPATISGTITKDDVVGAAAAQGIEAGEFREVKRAIKAGFAYVNVHSTIWPGGEARGQLRVVD